MVNSSLPSHALYSCNQWIMVGSSPPSRDFSLFGFSPKILCVYLPFCAVYYFYSRIPLFLLSFVVRIDRLITLNGKSPPHSSSPRWIQCQILPTFVDYYISKVDHYQGFNVFYQKL